MVCNHSTKHLLTPTHRSFPKLCLRLVWPQLHLACASGSVPIITALFEYDVDVNLRNFEHRTPLGEARFHDHMPAVDMFMKRYALVLVDHRGKVVATEAQMRRWGMVDMLRDAGRAKPLEDGEATSPSKQQQKSQRLLADAAEGGSDGESEQEEELEDEAAEFNEPIPMDLFMYDTEGWETKVDLATGETYYVNRMYVGGRMGRGARAGACLGPILSIVHENHVAEYPHSTFL